MKSSILNQKGLALFIVLWVLVLLSVIVGEFCHTMRTEVNITRNFKEQTQAYYIAVAGFNTAVAELIKSKVKPLKPETPEQEDEDEIQWRINTDIPAVPFAQGHFKVEIENESGKININRAEQGLLIMMLGSFDLEDDDKKMIADSVLDWRDPDQLHRLNGAEDDYYQGLPEPYECKDADFDSVEELLLVKGITPEIYRKLRNAVTVYQDEQPAAKVKANTKSKKKEFDFNKININAASREILGTLPEMTEDMVQEIIEYRKEKDFKSLGEFGQIVGPDVFREIVKYLTLETLPCYKIESTGIIENSNIRQTVQALVIIDTKLKKKYRIIQWIEK
ncbi:MAG: general secretion pathway protein GspK [Desulfobacteraceae bacterium]|nr:general secretion pathway protein GspK [Desulfobacteraceae bacterium]